MAIKTCQDINNGQDTLAVYFDGTKESIIELQKLLSGSNQLNMSILHTKIGWWAVKYRDGSMLWKRGKCFNNNFKILK